MTKNRLTVEFSKGNPSAFAQIKKIFGKKILTFAHELTGSKREGQRIKDYCFKKLKNMCKQFDTMENIKAFLYITARNNSLSCLRSKQPKTIIHRLLALRKK